MACSALAFCPVWGGPLPALYDVSNLGAVETRRVEDEAVTRRRPVELVQPVVVGLR
jgi:hypothetical protein